MSVDYDSVSGIGIEVTPEVREKFMAAGLFGADDWDRDPDACLQKLGLVTGAAGSCYDNEGFTYYLFVEGMTLGELIAHAPAFVATLRHWGVDVVASELQLINDFMVS